MDVMFKSVGRILSAIVVFFINIYRFLDRRGFFGSHSCRFSPSCSVYFEESLRAHGFFRGSAQGLWRILRCNPLSRAWGDDPVKKNT